MTNFIRKNGEVKTPHHEGPEYLYSIPPRDLFDYRIGLNPDDNNRLVELFYLRYGNRQIGYDSIQTFKNQIKAHYFMIWPKYSKLYATINSIKNPFITRDINRNGSEIFSQQDKMSNTSSDRNETGGNIKQDSYRTKTYAQGDAERSYSANNLESVGQKDTQEADAQNSINTDTYSDTPQSGVKNGESDKSTTGPNGEKQGELFNDGYITTIRQITNSQNTANATTLGETSNEKNDAIAGRNATSDYNDSENSSGGSENYQETTNLRKGEETRGKHGGNQSKDQETGFDGLSVSALLQEYRETCLPIDLEFIDEFRVFFYNILRS